MEIVLIITGGVAISALLMTIFSLCKASAKADRDLEKQYEEYMKNKDK